MVWACFKNVLRQKPKSSEHESESKTLKRIHAFLLFLSVGYFMMLSVFRLYSVRYRMTDELERTWIKALSQHFPGLRKITHTKETQSV
jgi:hypothetical protein